MELIHHFIDFIINIAKHPKEVIIHYGTLAYIVLFVVIFCETGLVVTPFLPGDSLLFAAGVVCAGGELNIHLFAIVLIVAAFLGNLVNYQIGRFLGPAVFNRNYKLLRKDYLEKAHTFYEKYGAMTIIYSRFIPIIRTFAPFVAGAGKMGYGRFTLFNLLGGTSWVVLFLYAGYFFGTNDFVQHNFEKVMIGIIIISVLPVIIGAIRARKKQLRLISK